MADSLTIAVDGAGAPTSLTLVVNDPISIAYFKTALMPGAAELKNADLAAISGNLLDPSTPSAVAASQRRAVLATAQAALRAGR